MRNQEPRTDQSLRSIQTRYALNSLMGHLLLDVSCFCADIYYMVPFIMVQHFVHSHYISYGTVKSMNYAL